MSTKFSHRIRFSFIRETRAAAATEYAVLLGLLVVGVIASVSAVGMKVRDNSGSLMASGDTVQARTGGPSLGGPSLGNVVIDSKRDSN